MAETESLKRRDTLWRGVSRGVTYAGCAIAVGGAGFTGGTGITGNTSVQSPFGHSLPFLFGALVRREPEYSYLASNCRNEFTGSVGGNR